ncbi:MAG: HAD family hydrolase [Ruminiclostridium sp.]
MKEIVFEKDKPVKLIATDMDGTLLDDNKNFPVRFAEYLDQLNKLDIRFFAASGRSYVSLEKAFGEVGFADKLDYICDNGAYIVKGGKPVFMSVMDYGKVLEIGELCGKLGVTLFLCATKGTYHLDDKASLYDEVRKYYPNLTCVNSFEDIEDEVFKLTIFDGNNPMLSGSYNALEEKFGADFNIQVSGSHWIDIMNKGISKGSAIAELQKELGISYNETMSFGDFYNDAEMLKNSYYSVVMANANDDMKQYGRFETVSNNENGVGTVIEKLINYRKNNLQSG